MYFYKYLVDFYDSDESENVTDAGIVIAGTYADAVHRITSYYGDEDIIHLVIDQVGESEGILPKNEFDFKELQ